MFIPGNINAAEYLLTSAFSAVAAVFSWLARRSGKRNTNSLEREVKPSLATLKARTNGELLDILEREVKPSLATLEARTNGELLDKIREAVREEVGHAELVRAVSEEAVRDYLSGLLAAHLADDEHGTPLFNDVAGITERRKRREEPYPE